MEITQNGFLQSSMVRLWRFLCLLLLMIAPGQFLQSLPQDTALLNDVRQILSQSSYGDGEILSIRDALSDGLGRGIPKELLLPTIREGGAKRAGAGGITAALQREIGVLQRAREIFSSLPGGDIFLNRPGEWQRLSLMLSAGYSGDEMRVLVELSLQNSGELELFRPLSSLYGALSRWGLDNESLLDLCRALALSSVPAEQFIALPEIYRSASRKRLAPEVVTERIISILPELKELRDLARRVIY